MRTTTHADALARSLRVLGAAALIVMVLPVLLALRLAVRLTDGRPVLERVVDRSRHTSLRFRTRRNDDRGCLTAVGRLMERTHLAELPVLIDLLRLDGAPAPRARGGHSR